MKTKANQLHGNCAADMHPCFFSYAKTGFLMSHDAAQQQLCTSHLYPRPPRGRGMAGLLTFQFSKPCFAGHICGKSPAKKPPPPEADNIQRRTTNDWNHLNKFSSPIPLLLHMKFGFSWPNCSREDFEHTHTHTHTHKHIHTRIRDIWALNKLYMPLYSCTPELDESCSR